MPNSRRSDRQKTATKVNNLKKRIGNHCIDTSKWRTMTKSERDTHIKNIELLKMAIIMIHLLQHQQVYQPNMPTIP